MRGYQILSAVVHHGPSNQQALGTHLAIDRTVLTYLLDTLVEAGLVERVPDPADRRVRKVVATDAGTRLLASFEERVAEIEADLLSGLSEVEAQFLVTLVRRLSMEIHRAQPGINPCDAMDRWPVRTSDHGETLTHEPPTLHLSPERVPHSGAPRRAALGPIDAEVMRGWVGGDRPALVDSTSARGAGRFEPHASRRTGSEMYFGQMVSVGSSPVKAAAIRSQGAASSWRA
ncbi:MarR family winged helix-turn-helix transcriptional regulator [Streptomyces sp. NPDC007896]|uniref:MarR family winged helix-turn-helix transcriptional regulator n=1 Tax=Streptomyces sp. NPDC007896 TaxID=3364784 RepID=UPI0036E6122D